MHRAPKDRLPTIISQGPAVKLRGCINLQFQLLFVTEDIISVSFLQDQLMFLEKADIIFIK